MAPRNTRNTRKGAAENNSDDSKRLRLPDERAASILSPVFRVVRNAICENFVGSRKFLASEWRQANKLKKLFHSFVPIRLSTFGCGRPALNVSWLQLQLIFQHLLPPVLHAHRIEPLDCEDALPHRLATGFTEARQWVRDKIAP